MPKFKTLLFTVFLFEIYAGNASCLVEKNRAFRNVWHPSYQCNRLAYCDEEGCGKIVADKYCQFLGYECATNHLIEHNVGLTHSLSNRERCTGWQCDGFLVINCMTDLSHIPPKAYHYREREFVFPRFNDYRVDFCYKHTWGCGAPAANSFCSHMGYLKAVHFEKECSVQATKALGNQELCFGDECSAFKTIVCSR